MEAKKKDNTFFYVVGGIAAVFLIGVIFTVANPGSEAEVLSVTITQPIPAVPSTTTTAAPTDPHDGRPVYDEFLILSMLDSETGKFCRQNFGRDTAACYDAYQEGTKDFEEVIVGNLETRTSSIPTFPPDQYGCHPDGRCLDDYGVWCDQEEFESFEDSNGNAIDLCFPEG